MNSPSINVARMLLKRLTTLAILHALSIARIIAGDLPIHGLLKDALGKWEFTPAGIKEYHPMFCGSGAPNRNVENLSTELKDYKQWLKDKYGLGNPTTITLTDKRVPLHPAAAGREEWRFLKVDTQAGHSTGTWTMVYDEGFEVRLGTTTYFGFFKYFPKEVPGCSRGINTENENEFGQTKCYTTDTSELLMGWFTENAYDTKSGSTNERTTWGCFHGQKLKEAFNKRVEKASRVVMESPEVIAQLPEKQFIDANFEKHPLWKAGYPQHFQNASGQELANYRKQSNFKRMNSLDFENLLVFLQKSRGEKFLHESLFACAESSRQHKHSQVLPKEWTWGDPFLDDKFEDTRDPVINQGNCGSCYAVSAAYTLQERFRIALSKEFPEALLRQHFPALSAQTALSCSVYNQGCAGGYPFLVGKHAKELGLGDYKCMSYMASDDSNDASCKIKTRNQVISRTILEDGDPCTYSNLWFAKDYNYVGGCYECSSEEKIMKEIFYNGPVVAAIDAPDAFFIYSDGIFDYFPERHGKICDNPNRDLNGWEYTNHAITLVGWGEEYVTGLRQEPIKYWIVRNTWGPEWGNKGYAKVLRGKNMAGIESQASFIDPDMERGAASKLIRKLRGVARLRKGRKKLRQEP